HVTRLNVSFADLIFCYFVEPIGFLLPLRRHAIDVLLTSSSLPFISRECSFAVLLKPLSSTRFWITFWPFIKGTSSDFSSVGSFPRHSSPVLRRRFYRSLTTSS